MAKNKGSRKSRKGKSPAEKIQYGTQGKGDVGLVKPAPNVGLQK